jgi:hypothetical protein
VVRTWVLDLTERAVMQKRAARVMQ